MRSLSHPLVTGGAGFIGSTLCKLLLQHADVEQLIVIDKLTYAGSLNNLPADLRLDFHKLDIVDKGAVKTVFDQATPSCVFNLAAESHVDRSISNPEDFISTNIAGTENLLEICRSKNIPMIQISTDEVYGSIEAPGMFTESSALAPSSPYSASKAAGDLLCMAAHTTYGQDVVITRCSNNYGSHQYPEKLIPVLVHKALNDQPLPIYGDGLHVRDWIHVEDHSAALILTALKAPAGEIFNIGVNKELTNLEIAQRVLDILGKPHALISYTSDRPGHDRRYALDANKARQMLDWSPTHRFDTSFTAVVREIAAKFQI